MFVSCFNSLTWRFRNENQREKGEKSFVSWFLVKGIQILVWCNSRLRDFWPVRERELEQEEEEEEEKEKEEVATLLQQQKMEDEATPIDSLISCLELIKTNTYPFLLLLPSFLSFLFFSFLFPRLTLFLFLYLSLSLSLEPRDFSFASLSIV